MILKIYPLATAIGTLTELAKQQVTYASATVLENLNEVEVCDILLTLQKSWVTKNPFEQKESIYELINEKM